MIEFFDIPAADVVFYNGGHGPFDISDVGTTFWTRGRVMGDLETCFATLGYEPPPPLA